MTEQHHPQPHRFAGLSVDAEGLSTDEELGQRWAEFRQARASLAEVMSDDELRAFGINVDVLDERP
jgi:hypothetical protein